MEKEGLEKLSEAELERMAQEKIKDQKIELEKVKLVQFKDPIHNILNQKGCQSVWSASLKTFITISFILFFLVPVICRDSTNCVAFVCKTRIYGFGNLNESTRRFLFIAIISLVTVDHYLNIFFLQVKHARLAREREKQERMELEELENRQKESDKYSKWSKEC